MNETSKCREFRQTRGDFDNYLKGYGLDIGSGRDTLKVVDGMTDSWDMPQGDANYLATIANNTYDFVYSSHCLEHMVDVRLALSNWIRVLKPGGYLYTVIPDYIYYEKLRWPSIYNTDHKFSFSHTITRDQVKRQNHYNIDADLKPLIKELGCNVVRDYLELDGFDYNVGPTDQTLGAATSQICVIAQKLPA